MKILFYNTYLKKKKRFIPHEKGSINLYTCGPTVYNFVHLGNFRFYIFIDLFKRLFLSLGFKVKHVMNITNVGHLENDSDLGEDKINKTSLIYKKNPFHITSYYKFFFLFYCIKLRLLKPEFLINATNVIYEINNFIYYLEKKSFCYNENDNFYFNVFFFINNNFNYSLYYINTLCSKKKYSTNSLNLNFILWFNNSKYKNHIMRWQMLYYNYLGFPGWHIECSAISSKYFSSFLDFHISGEDHIYIHNKNEIFQSESFFLNKWVNVWMHCGFLLFKNRKMSKTLNNFLTLKSLFINGYSYLNYRFFCINFFYKNEIYFSLLFYNSYRNKFFKLINEYNNLIFEFSNNFNFNYINYYRKKIWSDFCDDLNTKNCVNYIWKFLKSAKINSITKKILILDIDRVLSFFDNSPFYNKKKKDKLLFKRSIYRINKKWRHSDLIRLKLKRNGIFIKDNYLKFLSEKK